MESLALVMGWIVVIFIGVIALVILWKIITDKIKLDHLISDLDCYASMSRFQFLIFTFVIATSLLLIITSKNPPGFPDEIPTGVFALLGISGGSYVISKGIDGPSSKGGSGERQENRGVDKG